MFPNNLLFFSILNKHEDNFHNSRLMELVRLIHARSIWLWWDPTYVIFSLTVWLIYLIGLPHSVTMHAVILYLCTNLVSYDSAQLVTKVRLVPYCVYLFICYHAGLAFTPLIIVRYPQLINQLSHLLHLISRDPF